MQAIRVKEVWLSFTRHDILCCDASPQKSNPNRMQERRWWRESYWVSPVHANDADDVTIRAILASFRRVGFMCNYRKLV